ncbi:hypothetical protein K474DRAFT_1604154 [Panus rudis PR-1116 ss-1]|nr:hypothetical protein K474DRAFT_1604154 [Panus rudis PR-1116 ss-1]
MSPGSKGLAVLRAVITRWTTHYLAYARLLVLQLPLQSLVQNDATLAPDQRCVIIGDARAKAKAEEMVEIIQNPQFWQALARFVIISA